MSNVHIYFFNIDISLIMTVTCMTYTHNAKIQFEGRMSQNFDLGFISFCFDCIKRKERLKNVQKLAKITRCLS